MRLVISRFVGILRSVISAVPLEDLDAWKRSADEGAESEDYNGGREQDGKNLDEVLEEGLLLDDYAVPGRHREDYHG